MCIGLSILWLNFTFFHHLKPLFAFQRLRQTSVLSFRITEFVLWYFGTGLTLPLSECTVGLCCTRFKVLGSNEKRISTGSLFYAYGFLNVKKKTHFHFRGFVISDEHHVTECKTLTCGAGLLSGFNWETSTDWNSEEKLTFLSTGENYHKQLFSPF